MTRGTTPTYTIVFDDAEMDLAQVAYFFLTLKQCETKEVTTKIEAGSPYIDVQNKTITWTLTQEDTLLFKEGEADLQIRGMFLDDTAFATKVYRVPVNRVLYEEVI